MALYDVTTIEKNSLETHITALNSETKKQVERTVNHIDSDKKNHGIQIDKNSKEYQTMIQMLESRWRKQMIFLVNALADNDTNKVATFIDIQNQIQTLTVPSVGKLVWWIHIGDIQEVLKNGDPIKVQEVLSNFSFVVDIQKAIWAWADGKFGEKSLKKLCTFVGVKFENTSYGIKQYELINQRTVEATNRANSDKELWKDWEKEFINSFNVFQNAFIANDVPQMQDLIDTLKRQKDTIKFFHAQHMSTIDNTMAWVTSRITLAEKRLKQAEVWEKLLGEKLSAKELWTIIQEWLHLVRKDWQTLARLGPYTMPAQSVEQLKINLTKIITQSPSWSKVELTLFGDGLHVSVPFGQRTVPLALWPRDFEAMWVKKDDFARFTNQILNHRA